MKKIKLFFILAFMLLLLLPAIFINTKKNVISEIDNRKLVEFPRISTSFLKDIQSYFNDRYGGRGQAIEIYDKMLAHFFGILVHPSYEYGKENHIYLKTYNEVKYSEYHDQFIESISKIRDKIESRNVKFYMMINPDKKSVYSEYIREGINYNRIWLDELIYKLKKKNINVVDTQIELKSRSQNELVYDVKYDAGHWNDLGAFYGVNYLLEAINKDFKDVKLLEKDDFIISEEIREKLKVSNFLINDISPIFTLKNEENYDEISKKYSDIKIDSQYSTFSYNVNKLGNNLPKALVFQGSYLNGREKFLKSRFSEYIAIHNYQNIFNIDYYLEKFNPDIVVFEVAEYTVNKQYFSRESIDLMVK